MDIEPPGIPNRRISASTVLSMRESDGTRVPPPGDTVIWADPVIWPTVAVTCTTPGVAAVKVAPLMLPTAGAVTLQDGEPPLTTCAAASLRITESCSVSPTRMYDPLRVTVRLAGGPRTVTVALPCLPLVLPAVMVAVPADTPVTTPLETVATAELLVVQVSVWSVSTVPAAVFTVAVSVVVAFTLIEAAAGARATEPTVGVDGVVVPLPLLQAVRTAVSR